MDVDEVETRLIRMPELMHMTGLGRTSIWRKEKAGAFPRRRRLGPNSVAWLLSEVQAWLRSREVVAVGRKPNELPGASSRIE